MADNNQTYEERISALEARIEDLEIQKASMMQALQDLSARIDGMEIRSAGSRIPEQLPVDTEVSDAAEAPVDTSEPSEAVTDSSAVSQTPAEKIAPEEPEPSADSLEDKYSSEGDTKFDPSSLDPELLKFFESVKADPSGSVDNKETVKAGPEKNEAPAPKPVRKQIMRRPGFHLYNWFYYANQKDHGKLYRMKEDGSQNERMTDYPVDLSVFKFSSGHLYLRDANWAERTIRLSNEALDAYDLETEVDMANVRLNGFRYKGWYYYANPYMGYFLYRVKEDGTCHQRLTEYTLPRTQTFRVLNNDLCFYDDFYKPHQIPIRP